MGYFSGGLVSAPALWLSTWFFARFTRAPTQDESGIANRSQKELCHDHGAEERYFITGLPVAEDTFGVEMFKQMGIAAPFAGLIVFLLM